MTLPQPAPLTIPYRAGTLAALDWGPRDGTPVLALHGWLDHAESFVELAPCLDGCRVVALDLPGQGDSTHRTAGGSYNLWEDIPAVAAAMDALGWRQAVILGHSRGAMISTLFAATMPERVRALITLDALMPRPVEDADFVTQLRKHFADSERLAARPARILGGHEEFIKRRQLAGNLREVAIKLAPRALAAEGDGYRHKADLQLQAASAVKMNMAQIDTVLKAVAAPTLCLWFGEGLAKADWTATIRARAREHLKNVKEGDIACDHHGHMHPATAREIAARIANFLNTNSAPA